MKQFLDGDSVDLEQLRSEYVALCRTKSAENIDAAAAIMTEICSRWGEGKINEGMDMLGSIMGMFLQDEETQADFLFWWQEWCAKDMEERKALFVEGLNIVVSAKIIKDSAIESWSGEQEDCNEQQRHLMELYEAEDPQ